MPERNLGLMRQNYIVLSLIALTVVATQLGCTKLRSGPLGRDLLGKQDSSDSINRYMLDPQNDFNKNQVPSDSASPTFASSEKPKARTQAQAQPAASMSQDQARLVGIENSTTSPANPMRARSANKSFALTPAPPLRDVGNLNGDIASGAEVAMNSQIQELSEGAGDSADEDCAHEAECDCHKPKRKPKLPFAQQIEPPTYDSQELVPVVEEMALETSQSKKPLTLVASPAPSFVADDTLEVQVKEPVLSNQFIVQSEPVESKPVEQPAITSMVPSSALVSQPLKPILFNSDTREVQPEDIEVGQSANSLRRNEKWSHEKSVEVANRLAPAPSMAAWDQAVVEPGPVRFEYSLKEREEVSRSDSTKLLPANFETCQNCRSAQCDGSCFNRMRRKEQLASGTPVINSVPVVDNDPVVIVATTSKDTVPPFAEPPEQDVTIKTVSAETDENQFVADASQASANFTEDDPYETLEADEGDWLALFGPMAKPDDGSATSHTCPGCQSDACFEGCEKPDFTAQKDVESNVEVEVEAKPKKAIFAQGDFDPSENVQTTFDEEAEGVNAWPQPFEQTEFQPSTPAATELANPTTSKIEKAQFVEREPAPMEEQRLELPDLQLPEVQIPKIDMQKETPPTKMPVFEPEDSLPSEINLFESQQDQLAQSFAPAELMKVAPVGYNAPVEPTFSPATTFTPAPMIPTTTAIPAATAIPTAMTPAEIAEPFVLPNFQPEPAEESDFQPESEPEVRIEVVDKTVPWTVKLDETIENVRAQLSNEADPNAKNGIEVNLRLLEMLERQMRDIDQRERQNMLSNGEKQYWKHQLDAITLMLDSSQTNKVITNRVADNTLGHLRKAVDRLEALANLNVTNGAFCTEISGFGQFKTFPSTNFKPRQRMLIYCEVENYLSNQKLVDGSEQVHTKLRGSFAIYDSHGRVVQQAEYPVVDDISRKRRRDFYMYFPLQLGELVAGQYKLVLNVEDLNGNKTATIEPAMNFSVQ
ncbi:MAG: hypothetical protein AB8B55_17905 [Mariniblastus sp.]